MDERKNVLITGASTGIGYELAGLFARDGYNLILIARNRKKLEELSEVLKNKYGTACAIFQKDLSAPDSAVTLFEKLTAGGIRVDVLVNNAGTGCCGFFHEMDLSSITGMMELNMTSLTVLTKLISKEMMGRREGRILNVASTGSYQPGPYIAVYYATKAYVLSFSEAINNELKDYGITVSTLCPGATRTEFSRRAGKSDMKNAMEAETVAKIAYEGFKKGRRVIIPGKWNKIGIFLSRLLPRNFSARIIGKAQYRQIEDFKASGRHK